MTSSELVEAFWDQVWNAHDPDAVQRFVIPDFVITNAGHGTAVWEVRDGKFVHNWVERSAAEAA